MATTFNAIYLGQLTDMDMVEGDHTADNAGSLVGMTFGSEGDALVNDFVEIAPDGDPEGTYNTNNNPADQFTVDGGSTQTFDSVAVYEATITYVDGTTATFSAVVFQDMDGNTYLAPEISDNSDQAALEAGAIRSISLDSLLGDTFSGLSADRQTWDYVPCFTAGTRILTQEGERLVETLGPGDMVLTMDHGFQPLCWTGRRRVMARGAMAPIRFAPGALGNGVQLSVSPQHRMLVSGWRVEMYFGESEVLVPAVALVNGDTVCRVEGGEVEYVHIMFDRHQIVYAEGIPSESFMPGEQGLGAMGGACREEIYALFPELRILGWAAYGGDARPSLRPREARILLH